MAENPWQFNLEAFGDFLHSQRKMAQLSLRELSALSDLSNAYLSQLERGLHEPSMRAVTQIARALNISTQELLQHAGFAGEGANPETAPAPPHGSTEEAIRSDPSLTDAQKEALLSVYRSFGRGES